MSADHGDSKQNSSGENHDSDFAEEMPTMRSVPMLSRASGDISGTGLFGSLGAGFSKTPPPIGIPRPVSGLTKSTGSFGVKQEWSGSVAPSVWKVKSEDLELVPLDFPLERTHREIEEDAEVVARRISNALCALSIETEYVCEQAKAKCKTNDCVSFRIRLYAGSETGEPVVVEVQRRSGSASSFMRSCRAILDAAEGKDITKVSVAPKGPPFMKRPISQMKCLQNVPTSLKQYSVPFDDVLAMLRSNKLDQNILGLENLGALTDPVKSSVKAAVDASTQLLTNEEIREEVRVLTDYDVFSPEDEGHSRNADLQRRLALVVFANSLEVCREHRNLSELVQHNSWFGSSLVPTMIDEVRRSRSTTNNGYQAARCLNSLISCSENMKKLVRESSGSEVLSDAYSFGKIHHELLATETRRCLDLI